MCQYVTAVIGENIMFKLIARGLALSLAVAMMPLVARGYSISIMCRDTFMAPAGTVLTDRFTVRVADSDGNPMPGLVVWFFADCPLGVGSLPPCRAGEFMSDQSPLDIRTDANGVAVAPPYKVGGAVDVAAALYGFAKENKEIAHATPLITFFHINHRANDAFFHPPVPAAPEPEAEPPPQPLAAPPTAVPASSPWALLVLAALLAGFAARRRRQASW